LFQKGFVERVLRFKRLSRTNIDQKEKNMKNAAKFLFTLLMVVTLLAGCTQAPPPTTQAPTEPPAPTQPPAPAVPELILATTTSTQDSGLLDVIVPDFEAQSGYKVQTVAVGTGQALKMGEECNADVLLVHAPASEKTFMEAGNGKDRFLVMHNDFVIVGPAADPAGIKGSATAVEAFQKIAAAQAPFVSRGDDSGTHKMELALWKKAEITPEGDWYIESGQGMGPTLTIASEQQGYTLTDRATYLANKDNLDLEILVEGDPGLLNVYHVITVNNDKCTKANYDGAMAFSKYLTTPATQALIGAFGVDKFGQQLFVPDAGKSEADLGLE
jgi:tungstate transport system substrate-binding protein